MIRPDAIVTWEGNGKDGIGRMSTRSGTLKETSYTYNSRFKGGAGSTPEELIAAAHAGCFTMKLAFNLEEKGFTPTELKTSCTITFSNGSITSSKLEVEGSIPQITKEKFQELVDDAGKNCPVSKLLNTQITVHGILK